MKKIIGYITLFTLFYFHTVIYNPNIVNADDITNAVTSQENMSGSTAQVSSENTTFSGEITPTPFVESPILPIETTPNSSTPTEIETYFVVSAYYSPLPDQQHYLRGNYEDEVILNGRGLRGSSGKAVFAGMLAGPKTYNFGTKIYLEGLGIGEISDRGGAIVSATGSDSRGYDYDRIDVWMGFGEEGLKRALAWGKKTVKGKILLDNATPVSIDHSALPAPDYVVKNLVYKPHVDKSQNPAIFSKNITPESGSGDIVALQQVFSDMGMYESGAIDGIYNSIKETLINYQLKVGIIASRSDEAAGYFGPKTSAKLMQEYALIAQTRKQLEAQKKKIEAELASTRLKIKTIIDTFINNIGSPQEGDVGVGVRNLQKTLKALGYLKTKDSAIYGLKTKQALIQYQITKGIIASKNDTAAGVFGPKTKEKLKQELYEIMEAKYLQAKNLISYVK